jgi:hypothetical protein
LRLPETAQRLGPAVRSAATDNSDGDGDGDDLAEPNDSQRLSSATGMVHNGNPTPSQAVRLMHTRVSSAIGDR